MALQSIPPGVKQMLDGTEKTVSQAIADLKATHHGLLFSNALDEYESCVFARPMLLEALATIEVARHKLEQAELFKAREYAGNL